MELTLDALKTALRVLNAISERQPPNPFDVASLKGFAPLLAEAPLDELACDVIQQALRRRSEQRSRAAGL